MNATQTINDISSRVDPFNDVRNLTMEETWIYRAACVISRTVGRLDESDPFIIEVGKACASAETRGERSSVFHEANRIRNREHARSAARCSLCGGNRPVLNASGVHELCAARERVGMPTPSLGDGIPCPCAKCEREG